MATLSALIALIIIAVMIGWTLRKNARSASNLPARNEVSVGDLAHSAQHLVVEDDDPAFDQKEAVFQEHASAPRSAEGSTVEVCQAVHTDGEQGLSQSQNSPDEANPSAELAEKTEPLSEQELFIQAAISKAGQESMAFIQGEPQQAELMFEDESVPAWNQIVKDSFEKRVTLQPHARQLATVVPSEEKKRPEAESPKELISHLLVVYVMAPRSRTFRGEQVVVACQNQGLQHGERNIFHWYGKHGSIQFSVASAAKPGSFDLDNIQQMTTPGLSFILDMKMLEAPRSVFKTMLEVAHEIANQLGGDVLDDHHERLTALTVSDYLARVKTFTSLRNHYERAEV